MDQNPGELYETRGKRDRDTMPGKPTDPSFPVDRYIIVHRSSHLNSRPRRDEAHQPGFWAPDPASASPSPEAQAHGAAACGNPINHPHLTALLGGLVLPVGLGSGEPRLAGSSRRKAEPRAPRRPPQGRGACARRLTQNQPPQGRGAWPGRRSPGSLGWRPTFSSGTVAFAGPSRTRPPPRLQPTPRRSEYRGRHPQPPRISSCW